jgi:hypothetical protein
MKSSSAVPQLRGAIGAIALMAAFSVAPVGHAFAACSGMMCGPGGGSSSSSSGMSGHHGGGGGGMLGVGIGIGIGTAIGAGAASQQQQPSAPPSGTPPKRQRVAKPEPKPEPERKREVCSDGDIVPTINSKDWPSVIPRPVPELTSLRYPEPQEKYVVIDRDGKIRCIAGPWKLWVYHQLMNLPWPYDKRPVAPTGKEVTAYSIDEVAPIIKPQDGPRFGLTPDEMTKLLKCNNDKLDARLLLIFRASNPASLKYHNDPKYMPKPTDFYVKEDGKYTTDKKLASEKDPAPRSTKDMHSDETGIVQEKPGKPLIIDDRIVFADLDVQNAFEVAANGIFQQASTEQPFVDWINQCLGYELAMHGGESWFRGARSE